MIHIIGFALQQVAPLQCDNDPAHCAALFTLSDSFFSAQSPMDRTGFGHPIRKDPLVGHWTG